MYLFLWFWLEEVRHHEGYEGDGRWSHDESPVLKCDMMAVFPSTGVDGVHLSARAENGNSGQCQVERCPDHLYR